MSTGRLRISQSFVVPFVWPHIFVVSSWFLLFCFISYPFPFFNIFCVVQASKKWAENELDLSKQKVTAQLSAMGAATAQLVSLTNVQEEQDATALGAAIHTM